LLEFQWGESNFLNGFLETAAQQCFREVLMRILKARFPSAVTLDVQWAIAHQRCIAQLRQWIDAVARAQTAEEAVAILLRNA
jgi:hypothetical protein